MRRAPDEVRECVSCGMKVLGRGDQQDWKAIGDEDANLFWYCRNAPCRAAYGQRYLDMMRELNPGTPDEELLAALRQQIPDLIVTVEPDEQEVVPLVRGG